MSGDVYGDGRASQEDTGYGSGADQRGCGHQPAVTDPDTDSYSRQGLQRTDRPWSDVDCGAMPAANSSSREASMAIHDPIL